ncbi:MAG: tetratricopeptide repeat protein [Deltaproteobacteria bacterium]|nr:tetratricopeptide repeat protein [Deltaproteobacteria bacterium]MBW2536248.1 tetratricopeptide repeat protein [Deltaproteobacteria bacterium]
MDPHSEDARTGLESLLEVDSCAADAAEALADAYALTDDWQRTVALLDHRLAAAADDAARAKLLGEAAALMAERGDDPDGALDASARALPLDPANVTLESRVVWLAESTGGWAKATAALRQAAEASSLPERAAQLRAAEARIHDEQLHDTDAAFACYRDALGLDPRNLRLMDAVVRCAAGAHQWSVAASTVVDAMRTGDRFEPELIGVLDEHASTPEAYAELARGLTAAVTEAVGLDADAGPLDPSIAQRVEMTAARWFRDECEDLDSALQSAARAVELDPTRLDALELFSSLQRGEPSAELVETLVRIDERRPQSLDQLRDAADVALKLGYETARTLEILERLYRKAGRLWTGPDQAEGERSPAEVADWALDKLVGHHILAGNADMAVQALRDAARLPLDPAKTSALRTRAAEMLAQRGDRGQAIDLYRRVLEGDPNDLDTLRKVASLSEADGRISEALAMRLRELELTSDPQERLRLRLENSRLTGVLEERGGRVEALLANLEDAPGHPESLESLCQILDERGRHAELTDTLRKQAEKLEAKGDTARAAELNSKAARLATEKLRNDELAVECHTKVVELEPTNKDSLSALARLSLRRDEPAVAAKWLRKRLDTASDKERVPVLLQLARARIKAEKEETAIQALQTAFEEAPRNAEVRKLLFRLYRSGKNWSALASALSRATEHVTDESTVLAYAKDASAIYHDKLGAPAEAVPALRKAVAIAPDDRKLSAMLAEGLRLAGELDEARELLSALIEGFGRRRSTERAALHLELARVLHAQGEKEPAIEELDKASKMDAGNVVILHTLAELARENDEIDRAERAYRTLLLKVRRASSDAEAEVPIGAPEVLLELSRIAGARGQKDKADELLESAMEALSQNDAEAPSLQEKLREQGEYALLHRVLDTRLSLKQPPRRRAAILAQKAEVLENALAAPEDALEARLDAIKCNPASPVHHQAAWDLAAKLEQLDRYVGEVEGLLTETPEEDAHVRCELLLRLGEVYEKARDDLDRAGTYYEQAEGTGVRQVDVWRAQARLAGARGDEAEQLSLLNRLASLGEDQAETRASALYRMAEVQLASEETLAEGIDSLRKAMEDDARMERAGMILRRAADQHPQEGELLDIYARVARETEDEDLLLHYLERRTYHETGTPEHAHQATDLAIKLEQPERAEQLMLRAAEIGRSLEDQGGMPRIDWALLGLANLRMDGGDLAGAVDWLSEAVGVAEDAQVFALSRRVAELAAAPGGDLTLAAKLYERLLERDPTEREAWEPLADLYGKLGDIEGLERIVGETLDSIQAPQDRNALRVMLAKALLHVPERAEDAVFVLNDVLAEDPVHDQAQTLLADFLEKNGRTEELLDLLRRQFQVALERGEQGAIKAAGLRLCDRLSDDQATESLDVLRSALEHGDDAELLRALLARLGDEHDPTDRAALLERLLTVEEGATAGQLALDLSSLYQSVEDEDGALRVLKLGYERDPANAALRDALEQRYRDRGDFSGLARTLVDAASHQEDPTGQIALLREAASVYRDQLSDPSSAAALLRQASALDPDDIGLGIDMANTQAASGDHVGAVELLAARLDSTEDDAARLELLLARAELHAVVDDEPGLLHDLEASFAIDSARVAPMLEGALQNARVRAGERGDTESERSFTLRCVDVMMVQEKRENVSLLLAEWTDRAPDDLEALRLRRDIDAVDERWDSVATTCERLIDLEQDSAQVDAALSLAHAYRELGAPERSQAGLERARAAQPDNPQLRAELKKLYQQIGANRELAQLMLEEAASLEDPDAKREVLIEAGQALVSVGDAAAAVPALREAMELKPGDAKTVAVLADAYTLAGWFDDADGVLDQAIEATKGRRTPELCLLLHRKSDLARAQGNSQRQLELLHEAHTCNKKNGLVAAALADLAEELEQWDMATKTLRTISLIDTECPISRADAFLRQGRIAHIQGDTKNALMWARRAKREDPDSEEIAAFLEQLS